MIRERRVMKILSVSPIHFNNTSSNGTNPVQNPQISFGLKLQNTLHNDTVSFKKNEESAFFNEFGLLQKEYDENPINIKNLFNIDSKENADKKIVLNTFKWNLKNSDKPVLFFGDQKAFAKALGDKEIKTQDFESRDDSNIYYISYRDKNIRYNLKYDKLSGKLIKASASTVTKGDNPAFERVEIKPSVKKQNSYIVHYKFIQSIKNSSAVEDTYLLYEAGKDVPEASYTTKHMYYRSMGKDKQQSFVKVYNEDGFSKNVQDTRRTILY